MTSPWGRVYLAGTTNSPRFPAAHGALDPTFNDPKRALIYFDRFLACLDPRKRGRNQPVFSTFFGGTGTGQGDGDRIYWIAVDRKTGVVAVSGAANSYNFPVTTGTWLAKKTPGLQYGAADFFRLFHPFGTELVVSTYLGGPTSFPSIRGWKIHFEPDGTLVFFWEPIRRRERNRLLTHNPRSFPGGIPGE